MEFKELKNKKESDLHAILAKSRGELRSLRFKESNRQLKNVREMRNIKKNIAQILTLLNSNDNVSAVENKKNEENK
ncbi:MAG: 50S ribosomal protein L29 [Patescibacteria group bacterium]